MTKNYSAAEVRQKWKQREAAIGWTELREVNLGAVIDGQRYIGAGGTQVWVTEQGRSAYKVERGDANVPDAFGRLVVVGIAPGRTYVQLFTGAGGSNGNPTAPTPGGTIAHAPQHELVQRWRQDFRGGDGVDPAFLWQHQVKDLLVEPESGFTCRVNAGWASVNGTDVYVPEGSFFTVDSGQVPAGAGDAVICRVELDDTGAFQLSYGTDYAEPVTPETALGNAPAATTTCNTLAYIWIPDVATGIKRNYILPTALHVRAGGGSGSGVEDFTDLGDVPASYSGQAGKFVKVNATEDALEFVSEGAGTVGAKIRRVGTVLHDETLGSAGTFDVTSISQDYDDLEIILEGRGAANSSGGVLNVNVSLNNDTTDANYRLNGSSSGASPSSQRLAMTVVGDDATAGRTGTNSVMIHDYASALYKKMTLRHDSLNTTSYTFMRGVEWVDTSAVNRVTIAVSNANTSFAAGTRLRIIGWREEAIGGLDYSEGSISSTPTAAEVTAIFGSPSAVGEAFAGVINDDGANTNEWLVWSDGTKWFAAQGTELT